LVTFYISLPHHWSFVEWCTRRQLRVQDFTHRLSPSRLSPRWFAAEMSVTQLVCRPSDTTLYIITTFLLINRKTNYYYHPHLKNVFLTGCFKKQTWLSTVGM